MTTCHDVAAYILKQQGVMSAMKLQKLVYYCQAWSLVWDDKPMFDERIEAWANGPVVPDLYYAHRGQFQIDSWAKGNPENLDNDARDTVNLVLEAYGEMNAQQLSDLTHSEFPWVSARGDLGPLDRSDAVISLASMSEYYSSIPSG